MLTKRIRNIAREIRDRHQLPDVAKAEDRRDKKKGLGEDPGIDCAVEESLAWICRAQDCSISGDGGVARHYSLIDGWGPSYPETTGYIVPTIINCAKVYNRTDLLDRARKMLDWLVSIQLPDGGFQGGTVDSRPIVPVSFNTGQILLGLASGVQEFGAPYRASVCAAADWLVATQDADGCWRRHPSPFAGAGDKTYDTHIAWGLLEAARIYPQYAGAAMRNVRWALTFQAANGWFDKCCLTDPTQPLTHTIGYVLRGLIEAFRFSGEKDLLEASLRTAEALLGVLTPQGCFPGCLDSRWRGTVRWSCLTGNVQLAHCLLLLYKETRDVRFREAGFSLNRFVRCTVSVDGPLEKRGAVKGSFPVSGEYGQYEYLNWASKFFIDANLLEKSIREVNG